MGGTLLSKDIFPCGVVEGKGYRENSRWAGKWFVEIPRFTPTSKQCSQCGSKQGMPLSVRTYECKICGMVKDRDLNASINIGTAGHAVLACGGMSPSSP